MLFGGVFGLCMVFVSVALLLSDYFVVVAKVFDSGKFDEVIN